MWGSGRIKHFNDDDDVVVVVDDVDVYFKLKKCGFTVKKW